MCAAKNTLEYVQRALQFLSRPGGFDKRIADKVCQNTACSLLAGLVSNLQIRFALSRPSQDVPCALCKLRNTTW
mgnify:CR=1 FL=1